MKTFKNARVYVEGKGIVQTDLTFSDKVESFAATQGAEEIVLSEDCTIFPGFIDEHTHGAGGGEAADAQRSALIAMANQIAKSGTTAFLPTVSTRAMGDMVKSLACIREYMDEGVETGAQVVGVHMEGPFLAEKYKGAMREEYIISPQIEQFNECFEASGNAVKLITLAPEREGAIEFIEYLTGLGVTVSLGHTAAKHEDVNAAVEAGASCVTHTYNAQSGLHHREVGMLGSALLDDRLACEIICDTKHVSVPAVQLLVKNKPKDKVVMITDSLKPQGSPDGPCIEDGRESYIQDGAIYLANGTLSGSVVPMNGMLKNMVEKVGVDLLTAVDFASLNPARNLKIDDKKGSIALGKDADFAVLDNGFNVVMTVRGGNIVYKKGD